MKDALGSSAGRSGASFWKVPALLAVCFGTLWGCSILEPQPNFSRFFILTPIKAESTGMASAAGLSVGLGPIHFPDYLKRTQVVTRTGPNSVHVSERDEWAAPLDASFRQVMAINLSRLLNTEKIVPFPWYSSTHIDYQVEMYVDRFDADTAGTAHLAVRWAVRDALGHTVVSRSSDLTAQAADASSAAGANALSQLLGRFSQEIAGVIGQVYVGLRQRGRS